MSNHRKSRRRPAFVLAATALVVTGIAGCGILDPESDSWRSDLEAARARWSEAGTTDYRYVVRQLCFCGYGGAKIEVEVRDGGVVSGTVLETGEVIDSEQWMYAAPSIEDLFVRIQGIVDNDPHEFSATYDPLLGYPLTVNSDPIENAVDEEWGVEVTGFEEIQ